MAISMNVFRIVGDLSHTASKCILIWAIHRNKSAEGVSLLTQLLYMVVFGTRYLDLLWVPPWYSWWNTCLKIFYIGSSAYIVWLMMRVYARTREKEYAWKLATYTFLGGLISAPVVLWTFSIILESVCILPQLLLLRQTSVPTVLDSYYLVTLGSYRFFYILNWIVRLAGEHHFDTTSVIFGVIQTALYIDFAWVYYTRQRVKLRGGGVVDADDLTKSYLVRRIIGRGSRADHEDEDVADEDEGLARQENGTVRPPQQRSGHSWGARGISVSADDTLPERDTQHGGYADVASAGDTQIIDPAHFEDDDDDTDAPPPPVAKDDKYKPSEAREGAVSSEVDDGTTSWAQNTGEDMDRL
ncbi:hypothetical protein LTR37_000061 [Vermiconidia calcicola]|uniref:Uncharacterized protein n=1 Tax=Vermiconidia calcicola TaxID=1690605 RepID=A0ACC3NZ86_9PEZI|nr:hypothetical protein LTR37_000061 [Vermiconidia calcicola]